MTNSRGAEEIVGTVRDAFENEHDHTWRMLVELDPTVSIRDTIDTVAALTQARPRVCGGGKFIEKAACNFTHSHGDALPPAASERHPQLTGQPFSASALSVIVHPRVPRIPTVHMNVRFFYVYSKNGYWHFGGGMDLTPHFIYCEDAITWHEHALAVCTDHEQYLAFKRRCDEYFYLPHRQEVRGIGGIFFDDVNEPEFEKCFQLTHRVCNQFRRAYRKIFNRRKNTPWSTADEYWMLHRRSRYAEFNLIHDRGTKYGLQSGRRIESVLASMPPRANWEYNRLAETDEQRELVNCLQRPRDWLTQR